MGCCGQKRSALRAGVLSQPPAPRVPTAQPSQAGYANNPTPDGHPARPVPSAHTTAAASLGHAQQKLRYRERSRIVVLGPATGRHYEFSAAQPVQSVDPRDTLALLRTGFFEPVY